MTVGQLLAQDAQLRDSPVGRPTENRTLPDARVVGLPRVAKPRVHGVGGLHHRYLWREAA